MGGRSARLQALLAGGPDDEEATPGRSARLTELLGGGSPERAQQTPPTDMDFSSEPLEVPRDNSPLGILNQLLHGNAQRDQEKREAELAAQGVQYEQPSVADPYMSLMSPLGAAKPVAQGVKGLARALGVAKNVSRNAGNEVVVGAAQAALDEFKEGTPPEELLGALLKAGGISGAADVALQGVGKVGRMVGDLGQFLGSKARNVVAGGTKKEAEAILDRFDQPEAIDEMLGGLLEKYSPSPWYGRSSGGYLKDIKSKLPAAEAEHSDALAQGAAEGVEALIPDAWRNVQQRAAAEAAKRGGRAIGDQARAEAAAYERIAQDLAGTDAPRSLKGFVGDKSALQSAASGSEAFRSIADSASDQASGFAGRVMRDELDKNLMGYATPETYEAFIGSRDKVRDLKTLEELLKNKTAAEQSGGDFGNAISGAVLGGGLGMATSALTPGDDSGLLGAGGAAAGLAMGTRSALRQAAGSWGADVGANMLKGGGAVARGLGNALDRAPVGALTAEAFEARSRGHNAVAAVENALETNPQLLGRFAERLANAQDKRVEITVLIDEDPEFRALIRQLTAGGR